MPVAGAVQRTADSTTACLTVISKQPNILEKAARGRHTRLPGDRHPYQNMSSLPEHAGACVFVCLFISVVVVVRTRASVCVCVCVIWYCLLGKHKSVSKCHVLPAVSVCVTCVYLCHDSHPGFMTFAKKTQNPSSA